jgi:hypothetical protein
LRGISHRGRGLARMRAGPPFCPRANVAYEHMFRKRSDRLHRFLSLFDDVLGDGLDEALSHPHRQPLRWQRDRRHGSVEPRPAECISPVASRRLPREREHTTR